MPEKSAKARAKEDARAGKSPTTQAGEFVREEMEHIREGKHGARSTKQAIAIGLSKARRAGVDLPPPRRGRTKETTRRSAERDFEVGQGRRRAERQPKVARAVREVRRSEGTEAASPEALSKQAKQAAARRRREGGVGQGVDRPARAPRRPASTSMDAGARKKRPAARKEEADAKKPTARKTSGAKRPPASKKAASKKRSAHRTKPRSSKASGSKRSRAGR